jgi:trans-aconitate 2-methyltransferase
MARGSVHGRRHNQAEIYTTGPAESLSRPRIRDAGLSRQQNAVGGYAFGDSAAAARRLGLLADLFEPPSRAFLERFAGRPLDLAVDLGCGTGHTTRLLAAVLAPRRTLGLDQSASFVTRAAGGAPPGVGFAVHDVTAVPFPAGPADLCCCRLLLSHLSDPAAALAAWATQLAPGGLLLADEVERIHTADPALRGYLDVAAALLASRGHTLEVGPLLHRLPDPPGLHRRHDRVATLAPPAARAAAMFGDNLAVWGDQAVADGVVGERERRALAADLATVAAGGRPTAITWELRQLAWEAGAPARPAPRR